MRAQEFLEYKINNRSGIGSVPYNQEVDYFGLRVAMRPSTFLKLALPHAEILLRIRRPLNMSNNTKILKALALHF
jgi:hypothetical protein